MANSLGSVRLVLEPPSPLFASIHTKGHHHAWQTVTNRVLSLPHEITTLSNHTILMTPTSGHSLCRLHSLPTKTTPNLVQQQVLQVPPPPASIIHRPFTSLNRILKSRRAIVNGMKDPNGKLYSPFRSVPESVMFYATMKTSLFSLWKNRTWRQRRV